MPKKSLHAQLDEALARFNRRDFIADDPIAIPHRFSKPQDIEISAFFAATLAWGQRKTILNSTRRLMEWMDNAPHDFLLNHQEDDLKPFVDFKHRTFNGTDALYFVEFLAMHYRQHESLESAFLHTHRVENTDVGAAFVGFRDYFFSLPDAPKRTGKHVASPARGSACKRLNMFLRWMVRQDESGVDFGLWKGISSSQLICPLDVHVQRVATRLGILERKQSDWKAALELTESLRRFAPEDPVKYDFALFGMGLEDKAKG